MKKNIFKNSLYITAVGLIISLLLPSNCPAQSQPGWLNGWKYRRHINIHNYSANRLTDYQVKVANAIYEDSGLLANWHFEEIDNGVTFDTSSCCASNKNATVYEATLINGKFGKGLSFNGNNAYVDGGDIGLVKTVEFYLEASNYADGILELNPQAYVSISSGGITAVGFNSPLIYVNGKLKGDIKPGFNHVVIATDTAIEANAVKIGVANSDYLKGAIDEVRLYDWELRDSDVKAHYQAKAKLDYGDVRFTDSDGTTLLDYYSENDGTFWVKIPYLDAEINHPIYVYYGNDQAVSLSNAHAVFDFFEDFSNQDIDQWLSSGWAVSKEGLTEGTLPKQNDSIIAKTNNAQLSRTLSLPSDQMKIEIYAAVNGDLAQNFITFYEDNVKKIVWDETGGLIKKASLLSSAKPQIKFILNSDGNHEGAIARIFVYKYSNEPGVSVSLYPEVIK